MSLSPSLHQLSFIQVILFGCFAYCAFSDSAFSNTLCDGVCVPLAQCKSDFGGLHLVDIRFSVDEDVEVMCNHYLEVCCAREDVIPKVDAMPRADTQGCERSGNVKTFHDCGIRNQDGVGFHITHAKHNETEFGEFPWVIAVMQTEESQVELLEPSSKYLCGGSLIAPNVVLTAAHCVMDQNPETLIARAGEWDIATKNEFLEYQEQRVERVVKHPNFHPELMFNDLALLVLENQFVANEHVQLICLPPQNVVFNSDSCFTTGWGKVDFVSKHMQAIMKRIQLPTVSRNDCQTALRTTSLGLKFRLHDSFICAGGQPGEDACTGDGGSPLMCPVPGFQNKYYQAGIVAWGMGCGQEGIPGVYVRTSLYTNWIKEEIVKIETGDIAVAESFETTIEQ